MSLGLLLGRRVADVRGRVVDPVRVVEPVAVRVLGQQRVVGAAQVLHVLAVDAARQELVHHLHFRHQVASLECHFGEHHFVVVRFARLVQSVGYWKLINIFSSY